MKPDYEREGIRLYNADCMDALKSLEANSVQCCVTSPPYFALRSYLPAGHADKAKEIGSEVSPEAFIATMVAVFREVRRVLRDDGVCFINLGDSYDAGTSSKRHPGYGKHGYWNNENIDQWVTAGMAAGQLLNIPHRVAEALRADGWIWRQTIVWAKRSPMPESLGGWRWVRCRVKVKADLLHCPNGENSRDDRQRAAAGRDGVFPQSAQWSPCPGCEKCREHGGYVLRRGSWRTTTAHEYVFLFAKTSKYFCDGESAREAATYGRMEWKGNKFQITREADPNDARGIVGMRSTGTNHDKSAGRNPRSVWTLSSEPTSEHHYATFPSELVRRCLVAGISAGGCCRDCGAPLAPVVESERVDNPGHKWGPRGSIAVDPETRIGVGYDTTHLTQTKTLGYRPTCTCPPATPIGCLALDPFSGLATTGQTARQLGARYVGIELNPEYHAIACERVWEHPRWWIRKHQPKKVKRPKGNGQVMLF